MIRRIVGIAGVADLESISDDQVRTGCERRALLLGQRLLKQVRATYPDLDLYVKSVSRSNDAMVIILSLQIMTCQ